jgi:hypothetical protein
MLLYRLDGKVVNLPHMADACHESDNLASLGTAVPDYCSGGIVVWECGWNVTLVSVGRVAPDNRSRLQQSGD